MIGLIDEKLKNSRPSDLRFFRVEEFKRNVDRVGTYSGKCPVCNKAQINIKEITAKIDVAIESPGKTRREYDRLMNRLATHMNSVHGFYTPNHFTYSYSLYGMLAGTGIGFILMMFLSEYNMAFISAGFSIGLLIGYLYGSNKDRKIRQKKMLM